MGQRTNLDATDVRLLELLQEDGRRSFADLGSVVGLSAPSVHERVKKLEARGVITRYAALVDPAAAGFPLLAFVWLTQVPGTFATDLTNSFAAIPEVEECHHIAGEADYLLKVRARDTAHLERVLRGIQTGGHVFTTETSVVFSSAFERRPLPLTETDPANGT